MEKMSNINVADIPHFLYMKMEYGFKRAKELYPDLAVEEEEIWGKGGIWGE